MAEQAADVVAASYWWQRLLEVAPSDVDAGDRLDRLMVERGRRPRSASAGSAGAAGAAGAADRLRAVAGRADLLVVNLFYPSVRGTERRAEQAAIALRDAGMTV